MPIYEYRCDNGHEFEVLQRISDDPVEACEECGAPVERVYHPVAVHYKGSGFYTTDYAKQSKSGDAGKKDSDSGSGDSGSGDSSKKSDSSSSSDSKSSKDSKAASASD